MPILIANFIENRMKCQWVAKRQWSPISGVAHFRSGCPEREGETGSWSLNSISLLPSRGIMYLPKRRAKKCLSTPPIEPLLCINTVFIAQPRYCGNRIRPCPVGQGAGPSCCAACRLAVHPRFTAPQTRPNCKPVILPFDDSLSRGKTKPLPPRGRIGNF